MLGLTSTALSKLWAVVLFSSPSIVGTGFFLAGVTIDGIFGPGAAPAGDPWREPTVVEGVKIAVGAFIFGTCYLGAAFGPLLLPLAAWESFWLTRVVGLCSRVAVCAWTIVGLAGIACALFWGWLTHLDIFI